MFQDKTIEIEYKCEQCGATDRGRYFLGDDDPIAPCLNCHSCGAGRGQETGLMLRKRIGMFPVAPEPAVVH